MTLEEFMQWLRERVESFEKAAKDGGGEYLTDCSMNAADWFEQFELHCQN